MSETKTQITLPTYVNKGKARETGVFEVLTIEQVRAWSEPKRQECDHNVPINHLSQEQEMQNSRVYLGTPYCYDCQTRDIHLPTCRFFACGRCSGTGVQSIDLTPSHVWFVTINGDAREAKVNGKVRTWKRDTRRVELPIKYGMYEYGTFDASDIEQGRLLRRVK
jgi:hypothetical protein